MNDHLSPMRFLSFGAGAIGTYIGGSLEVSGNEVVYLERPDVVGDLAKNGLTLKNDEKVHHILHPTIVSSLDDALAKGPYDIAIFAVKSYDTENALVNLLPHKDSIPPILCIQNGVENEMMIGRYLGKEKVISGTVTSAIGRVAAGNVVLERLRGVGVAGGHPLVKSLVDVLNQAGLNAKYFPDANSMKWSKMVTNLICNATSAILDMLPVDIFSNPRLASVEILQLRETLQVMKALGINTVNLPGVPVGLLGFAIMHLPQSLTSYILQKNVGKGRGGKMPSFYLDLKRGHHKSEVDYLNGAVVRYGNQVGISTPVNKVLRDLLIRLTSGELKQDEFVHQPDKLLELLPQMK